MSRRFPLVFVFLVCASAVSWPVPTRDLGSVMGEFKRAADEKEIWLVPDPGREFAGDFIGGLKKEAAGGNAKAQATLGLCHQLGLGLERDSAKAVVWYD